MKDEILLRKIRAGDVHALEKLMDRYIPYVSATVWRILRSSMTREDAEEVASDVFLALWEGAEKIRPDALKPWLGAVARNKARNKLRDISGNLPLEEDVLELPGKLTPEGRLEREEEARLVREAVDSLGEPDREIFLRHYYYAQTVSEIARDTGHNQSTIKTKLRRGRQRLKTMLTRWGAV